MVYLPHPNTAEDTAMLRQLPPRCEIVLTPGTIIIHQTNKVPVIFYGELLYSHGKTAGLYFYLTKEQNIVFERRTDTHIKARRIERYKDVWTLFQDCNKCPEYLFFLKEVSQHLTHTDSYFWLPL